jgi:type IV pilus assembly protein PilM
MGILAGLLKDPPPKFVFELSEAGIAMGRHGRPPQIGFQPLEPEVIAVSAVRDNVLRLEALTALVQTLAPAGDARKRHRAVLSLPDGSARVSVLDFDAFPSEADQQLALVKFRVKKSLPFEVETARLSYFLQAVPGGRLDVVVALAPLEVVARFEAPFRAAGFHPGLVTSSTLAALALVRGDAPAVLVKLTGRLLTISVLEGGRLKLLRSIELAEGTAEEILGHLYPTFAYAEDQLAARPGRLLTCGFDGASPELSQAFEAELGVAVEPLRSRWGAPTAYNAGLLGCLEWLEDTA